MSSMKDLKRSIARQRAKLREHQRLIDLHAPKLRVVLKQFSKIGAEARTDLDWVEIKGMGDKQVALKFIRLMRRLGFERPTIEKDATSFSMVARLGEWHSIDRDDRLSIYFYFSSTACRRVQVGTKVRTIEEPVYEVRCDEPAAEAVS